MLSGRDLGGVERPPWYTHQITSPPQADWLTELLSGKSQNHLREIEESQVKDVLRRLDRWRLQSIARKTLPKERVGGCMRRRISMTVQMCASCGKAHYKGLMACAGVWICPICAAKISERRCVELRETMLAAKAKGLYVYLITQTVPHYGHQPLVQVLEGLRTSRRLMRKRKPWERQIVKGLRLAGTVRGLEVTYGDENGWHPHVHELIFIGVDIDNALTAVQKWLFDMWESACLTAGLNRPNKEHGITIQGGSEAEDYVAKFGREDQREDRKWGLEHELTKSHIKTGKEGRLTPWDLLRGIGEGNIEHRRRFREYAKAFKGKHQLVWSKGLRAALSLGEVATDEELAGQGEENEELLGRMDAADWRIVLRADRRGEVLEEYKTGGWAGMVQYLYNLGCTLKINLHGGLNHEY